MIQQNLFIHIHPSCFSFAVYDSKNEIFVDVQSKLIDNQAVLSLQNLNTWFQENEMAFQQSYAKHTVAIDSKKFSLVDDLTLATKANFKIINKLPTNYKLKKHSFLADFHIQFAVKKTILEFIESNFEDPSICFGDSGLIHFALQNKSTDAVYAQLLGNDLAIAAKKENKLVLFNKYKVKSNEDVLYFTLLAYQANHLDPNKDVLHLSGLIEKSAPRYQLLYDYVRNIDLNVNFDATQIENMQTNHSIHYFTNLLNLKSCG